MRCNNVLGLIFAGTLDEKMPDLTSSRTMASVPVGGKYRIIDFVLSNMSNSGINNVGVVATKNYLSLADHLGSGSAYDLSKRRSQLTLLTPYNGSTFFVLQLRTFFCTKNHNSCRLVEDSGRSFNFVNVLTSGTA